MRYSSAITSWIVRAECNSGARPARRAAIVVRKSVEERAGCRGLEAEECILRLRGGVDIIDVDVRVFPFCPPPVSDPEVAEKKSALCGRQVSCSSKITQKESALASIEPLQR